MAGGDLTLRFVEWFGFEELARTGALVNKRWYAASLVFAPPEAEFKARPGPKEIFDGYQTLGAWCHAHGISHLTETAQDKYLMCRSVPIAVEEMLLRGLFVANVAFTPIYTAFVKYFGGLLIVSRPDRRDTPEKRYLVELLRRDLKTYLAAEFPQTVHVRYSRLTAGPSRPPRPRSHSDP